MHLGRVMQDPFPPHSDLSARTMTATARARRASHAGRTPDDPFDLVHLDGLPPAECSVGYGALGTGGALGYDDGRVAVRGDGYRHALSTHPPARATWELDGRWKSFRCRVAINDDVPAGRSHADFVVRADGRTVAEAYRVTAGAEPVELAADVSGAQTLELSATTAEWEYSHAVWLDPVLSAEPVARPQVLPDCLGRVDIHLPPEPVTAARCICTVVSRGFERLLDDLLGSLAANGGCPDARRVVFAVDADEGCRRVAAKHGAVLVECTRRQPVNMTVKSVMYSAARVLEAERFVCMDADMLVLESLEPVFAAIDACPDGAVLACREGNGTYFRTVAHAFEAMYAGKPGDLARILGTENGEGACPLVVNDGIFAGGRQALMTLDGAIRGWGQAAAWVDEPGGVWWRNQGIFNLALAHLRCGVELNAAYNVQLNTTQVERVMEGGRPVARWRGARARVLHFNGNGRMQHGAWHGTWTHPGGALPPVGGGDGYAAFLSALRGWLGARGAQALAWSFYGTTDGQSGRVADPDVFPLFALLHYLLRANGCARVLETGTARGISAACIASAIAHRPGAALATLDLVDSDDRPALWAALPPRMRAVIDERRGDALELMDQALARGERYDAALLDSRHDEWFVYEEFRRARQLVCAGGLILVHDARYAGGTVERALKRIEADGYGVTRLWTAECGHAEDDRLGLAVIENRTRAPLDG